MPVSKKPIKQSRPVRLRLKPGAIATEQSSKPQDGNGGSAQVLNYLRELIQAGKLRPGDRLPSERILSADLQVSRPTIRAAVRSLIALGVLDARRGSGTYVVGIDDPPVLDAAPLKLMATLRGFAREEMFEARMALETTAAALAAEHATFEELAQMAEELAGIFAAIEEPDVFLVHDAKFHSIVAMASHNRIIAALTGMVVSAMYDFRKVSVRHAVDLKESARMHQKIYRAIRKHNAQEARDAMQEHLNRAHRAQRSESDAGASA